MRIVMKFGGTSVSTGEKIRNVANIVRDNIRIGHEVVVVVSAMGDITNQLIEEAEKVENGNEEKIQEFIKKLFEKHANVIDVSIKNKNLKEETKLEVKKIIDELKKILTGICYVGELTLKTKDQVLSFGERLSALIVSSTLKDHELESHYFTGKEAGIVTDSKFGEANPLMNFTTHQIIQRIDPLIEKRIIPVITGYIAANQNGIVTTLGRGGSDYTATILGVALDVDEVWIWTDVDGIMTSDPKIIKEAKTLAGLSYGEAAEMAIFGAKAMHPRALEPVIKKHIPVRIRNVFNPKNSGTLISEGAEVESKEVVKAIALINDVSMINIKGARMVGAPGSYAKIFDILGKNKINIMMVSTAVSEANISIIIRRSQLERAMSILEIALLGRNLGNEVTAEEYVSVIAVMGANMKGSLGVASRIFTSVAKKDINIMMIAQGSSELNISFVVKEKDGAAAVSSIHEEFNLSK
ncbi:MAG: aspartate kinase [Candidatus Bathyarchaeota archaeon]|nr:aspartate kinase [Candidatus Bathyarchaeota archaeon]